MDVFFSADDRQEALICYFNGLRNTHSISLCLMSHHAHFGWSPVRRDVPRARSEAQRRYTGDGQFP
jgi:hypothetical protein